jgi:ribonuclease HI
MGTKVCYSKSGLQTSQNPTHGNDTCCPNEATHAHGWTRNNSQTATPGPLYPVPGSHDLQSPKRPATKLGRNGRHKKGHIKWIESQVSNLPHSSLQDLCISTHWNRKFNTTIGDGTDIIHDKGLLCYTDGSGQGTGSGSGIAAYLDDKLDPIYTDRAYTGSATVFQAELHAIHMACEYALMQPHGTVNILSDSQAAIKAVTLPLIKSCTVLNTLNSLNKLAASGKNVTLRWVKAHNDIDGNELADILAKQGAALQLSGPKPFLLISHAVCKQTYKYELESYCNAKWQKHKPCRQTKIFFPIMDRTMSKNLLRLSRKELGKVIQHATGHSNL